MNPDVESTGPGRTRTHLSSVGSRYDALADSYDARWSGYVTSTVHATAERLLLRGGEQLLDVGCGTGALLEHVRRLVPDAHVAGIDLSARMLRHAGSRLGPAALLVRGDAGHAPFRSGSFDVVASVSSLHYWGEPSRTFDELARILKPGGRLVITDWCRDSPAIRLTDLYLRVRQKGYRRAYHARELRALLEERGFSVALRRYRVGIWWGMMTAVATRS